MPIVMKAGSSIPGTCEREEEKKQDYLQGVEKQETPGNLDASRNERANHRRGFTIFSCRSHAFRGAGNFPTSLYQLDSARSPVCMAT